MSGRETQPHSRDLTEKMAPKAYSGEWDEPQIEPNPNSLVLSVQGL